MTIHNYYTRGSDAWYAATAANEAVQELEGKCGDIEQVIENLISDLDGKDDDYETLKEEKETVEKELDELRELTYNDTLLTALVRIKLDVEAVLKDFEKRGVDVDTIESAARSMRDSSDPGSESADHSSADRIEAPRGDGHASA